MNRVSLKIGSIKEKILGSALFRTAFLSAATDGLAAVSGFAYVIISTKILYVFLGPTKFGVWATVFSLTAALAFLDFGLGSAAIAALARALRRGSATLVRTLLLALTGSSAVVALLVLATTQIALIFIDTDTLFGIRPEQKIGDLHQFIHYFTILLSASFPINAMTQALRGLQRAWIGNIARTFGYVAATIGIIIGSKINADMGQLLFLSLGVQLSTTFAIVAVALYRSSVGAGRIKPLRVFAFAKRLLSNGGSFVLLNLTRTFAWLLDYFIVARIMGPEAAAALAIMQRMYQVVQIGGGILGMTLWPTYSYLASGREYEKLKKVFAFGATLTVSCAASASLLIYVFKDDIAAVWLGTSVAAFALAYALQAIWLTCEAAGGAFSIFLNARGIVARQALGAIAFAAVSFGLKMLLVPSFGINGLVAATLVGYLVGNIVLLFNLRGTVLFPKSGKL